MSTDWIDDTLLKLPEFPGVYLMKDKAAGIVYVGKAKNLKQRVRQYFGQSSDQRYFVQHLPDILGSIETIVTSTVKEALILENELIKKYQPRFNVLLRDDKNFLHIRVDKKEKWPRLRVVRRPKHDGRQYFGPYHSASKLRATLKLLERYFQLRTCDENTFKNRSRPCLQYQIKRCPAPCVLPVDQSVYAQRVDEVVLFLQGRTNDLSNRLQEKMLAASEALLFEDAARYRDQLHAIRDSLEKQHMVKHQKIDQDVWGVHREGGFVTLTIMEVRQGRLAHTHNFDLEKQGVNTDVLLSTTCNLYYSDGRFVPDEVILSESAEYMDVIADALTETKGRKVRLVTPKRGPSRRLVEIACMNAEHRFFQNRKETLVRHQGLERLQEQLGLSAYPEVIECFDISLFQGGEPVASKVCYVAGVPARKYYRHYKIKTVEGTDDFAMMREVLIRRLKRGIEQGELPNLLVIDGGRGQLNVALAVVQDLGIDSIDLIGLAKARTKNDEDSTHRTRERVFMPSIKNPIALREHTDEYRLLTSLRDEAHRFAITFHRKLRRERNFKSVFDGLAGVGDERQKRLLRHFGGRQGLEKASVEALQEVPGIGAELASKIYEFFR
jgi:excinuclease ABC subunit C